MPKSKRERSLKGALTSLFLLKIRNLFRSKKSVIKSCGYEHLVSDEEQRWLDEYASKRSQLPSRIGIPYYD